MIVLFQDLKAAPHAEQYCNRGARAFCERWDIDWEEFKANGVDAKVLLNTGDAMAIELVHRAERRLAEDQS